MALPLTGPTPFFETMVTGFSQSALASGGARTEIIVPHRGRVIEVGFMPVANSCTSAITLMVALGDNSSAIASNFASTTPIVTSTLGSFSSINTMEGAVCSVIPPSPAYVNRGDAIQFTTSGGQSGIMGAQVYAIIRRG